MTREEAANWLEAFMLDYHDPMEVPDDLPYEVAEVAISALRPVSREQVERMFPGCTYCKPDSEGYVQKFGAYSILNGELETGHCKPQRINFFPHCSRPLTDEAMDIRLKELEALKDAGD